MKNIIYILLIFLVSCKPEPKTEITPWIPYDESDELAENAAHKSRKMQYKLIQSRILNKNEIWMNVADQIGNFSEDDYQAFKPLIFEQDILSIQASIEAGELSYEKLTQWYLYRIVKYENDSNMTLNSIISINPNAVAQAKQKDKNKSDSDHPIYGMPIILKDNVNTLDMATTAGAHAFLKNRTKDAFIVERIKEKGGIILGKSSLSEWANFLSSACPNGYSAVGGQTLNPYGRRIFDTGGSSSGSGASMAVSYAAAAVGTETSGSILSPSSKSSIVGLKPTIGLLSRGGIVPISSTLDTPGPMTRTVIDNAILLSAMTGEDEADIATKDNPKNIEYWKDLEKINITELRFGVNKEFLEDSIYKLTVDKLADLGASIFEFDPEEVNFEGFRDVLSADMKIDLPNYIKDYASDEILYTSVADIVEYNLQDTIVRMPYGQTLFEGIVEIEMSTEELDQLKARLNKEALNYFETQLVKYELDAILSINNWSAGIAAMAKYPCLTIPMGYKDSGEPLNLTFIARQFEEDKLLRMGYAFEQATKMREIPEDYK